MGLLDCKSGLIIGEKFNKILRAPLVSHALIFAPSRSGKGVSQVIPNALTFDESMIIVDVKDEIFDATSGFRHKHGQLVYSFALLRQNGKTHRWNPLDLIDKNSPRLVSDVDLITHTLIYNDGEKESMWVSEARTFLKGLILWLMDSGKPFNMGFLANFIKGTPNFLSELKNIRDNAINEDGSIKINQTAFTNINNFLNKAEKEQSGVRSTITARLNLWDDPLIQAATQMSDFDIRDIRKKRMTIYLGIPVDQIKRLAPLLNLFLQLFLANMTRVLPSNDEPYKVVAILDEFCALGRIDILKEGFGFLAGYNIYLMAIIQNVGQFYDIYGGRDKSDIFFQNTDYKIAFRQNVQTDKEFVSTLCGMYAVKNQTYSFHHGTIGSKQKGSSESYTSKRLISPDQVGTLSPDIGIAIFNGKPPIKYKRIIYYKDKRFISRILPPIDIPTISVNFEQLRVSIDTLKKFDTNQQSDIQNVQNILPIMNNQINQIAAQRVLQEKHDLKNIDPASINSNEIDEDIEI